MKHLITPAVLLLSFAACAADVGRVIVRQQWPWSTAIKVEFELKNVTNPVDVSLKAYNGTVPYDQALVDAATFGPRFALTKGDVYTLTLDPAVLFADGTKTVPDFKVTVTATESTTMAEVLYKILNLEEPYDVQDVTRGALLNGTWGAVETSFSALDASFSTELKDVLIWTGVTNDVAYKTTHMVFRKIPANGKTYKVASKCYVSFTNDYYMGVFPVTQAQFAKTVSPHPQGGSNETNPLYADYRPVNRIALRDLRGATKGILWPEGDHTTVDTSSYFGKMQARSKCVVDLPTESIWEYACRGGSAKNEIYTGNYSSDAQALKIMRAFHINCQNPGYESGNKYNVCAADADASEGPAWVGSYLPNAYGLYDTLGNIYETCLDRSNSLPENTIDNPEVDYRGPALSGNTDKQDRVIRGGCYCLARNSCLCYQRDYTSYKDPVRSVGFRACLYPGEVGK